MIDEEMNQLSDMTDEVIGHIRRVCVTVDVPEDLYDGETDEEKQREDHAIYVAREQLPDYVMPCNWYVLWNKYDSVRVARESAA